LTVHGYAAQEAASVNATRVGLPYYSLLRALEANAYEAANHIITVDTRIREYIRSFGVPDWRMSVIPNAVDTNAFHPHGRNPAGPDQTPTILCPRRLVPKNGPKVALEAVDILKRQYGIRVRLVYAGNGPLTDSLRKESEELGVADQVAFLGSVPHGEIGELFQQAYAVVIPSVPTDGIEEATSISALEGMASGRPVVASAIGGLREIIRDRETGILIPPGRADALAAAIAELLRDQGWADELGNVAWREVAQRFSTQQWIHQKLQIYRGLISG
jgi:glycosyltransferase involved in cell wall biosynthesis